MSSAAGTGRGREVLIFLVGLVVAAVAVFLVVRTNQADQETTTAPTVTSTDEAAQTAEPDPADDPEPTQAEDEGADGGDSAPQPPAQPVTDEHDHEPAAPIPGLELDTVLVDVPNEKNDPRTVAAAYIEGSRSLDYRNAPGAWLDEADYLAEEFAAQLQASHDVTSGEWDQDFIDRRFIMDVEDVQVKLSETDETAGALVYVQWSTYVLEKGETASRGDAQGAWVIVDNVDGQWLVSGEGHEH